MRVAITTVLVLWTTGLAAQGAITSRIVDANSGTPLGFATVLISGTTKGTITNADGYFSLENVSAPDSLRVSYVGYRTVLAPVRALRKGSTIGLDRAVQELTEFNVTAESGTYERVVRTARKLRKLPATSAKVFFGMETHSDTVPVEMIHAYYNARYRSAGLRSLDLKQGRIGIAAKNGRYFINYNTTRAFAMLDILQPQDYFPASPLEHLTSKGLKRAFAAEVISNGSGPDAVDQLRVTPRDSTAGAFTLDLWLDPETDRVRALDLYCTHCPKHPFLPLFEHGRIDTVDMRYRQTWTESGVAVPEIMQLEYRMAYSGPGFSDHFSTTAVMHAFDRSGSFVPTLFTYPAELADYRKIGWLPEDSSFWQRVTPPLPTARQTRDRAFLAQHDLRHGQWYEQLDNDRNFFGAQYALWSPERRVWLNALTTWIPDSTVSTVNVGWLGGHSIEYEKPKLVLVAQLYLDLDTLNGQLLHRSATVLDGFRTYDFLPQQPWTACFYNIWFDLCEMERRSMERHLQDPNRTVEEARTIHRLHSDRLRATTERYLRETLQGTQCAPLFEWNELVRRGMGIDNIRLLGM